MASRYLLAAVLLCLLLAGRLSAEPLVEKYLLDGKLGEGEKALRERLKNAPNDDEARFGLGVVQFLQTFEHAGAKLHKYGVHTDRVFAGWPQGVQELLPQNPKPEKLTYQGFREIVQAVLDDLAKVEATLAEIKDDDVKLPLHVALIRIDIFGVGKPVNASTLSRRLGVETPEATFQDLVVAFDRGDAHWLRGYCRFLSALAELSLAVDGQELFECTAHLFFERVDSPHVFLQEEPQGLEEAVNFNVRVLFDLIAFIHLWRFPVKEPDRFEAALAHLEAMLSQAKEMWKHYQAETDDDHEWIPNAKQTGVLEVDVTQEMIDTWLATLEELDLVLQGKRLVPFWRGRSGERGVNVRRAFTEPRTVDPILWVQGTAATPYLEKGELTKLATPEMIGRINGTFGGWNFFGFALWFN